MNLNAVKQIALAARVKLARAAGKTITEIVREMNISETEVLKILGVDNAPKVNRRQPRKTSRGRQNRPRE